jgi:hypothetical protein
MDATVLVVWLRGALGVTAGMESPWFYFFLFLHLVSLIVGFGAVLLIDVVGVLWIRGRTDAVFLGRVAEVTQRVIWAGWAGLVVSGIGLITLKGAVDSLTHIKLFFVFMIGVNGIALHFIKHTLGRYATWDTVPPVYKYHIVAMTVVSQVGWWGALFIGFIHRHIQHFIAVPTSPWPWILGISVAWLSVALVGHLWLGHAPSRR